MNEETWMRMGHLAEQMGGIDQALSCYLHALQFNSYNPTALRQVAGIYEWKGRYDDAVFMFERLINLENTNGKLWCALGNCLVRMNKPQRAYTAYQQAIFTLANPKDPTVWYGIALLYEQTQNWEHACEVFNSLLRTKPQLPQTPEIWFRYALAYKAQGKYQDALDCFQEIVDTPPPPLTTVDILCQCAAVYEVEKEYDSARAVYERVLELEPNNNQVLQRYAWILHFGSSTPDTPRAILVLERALQIDPKNHFTNYILGRCYATVQEHKMAHDCYQTAIFSNPQIPAYWGSIGVLYFTIGQFSDALDCYSRAIRTAGGTAEVQQSGAVVTTPGKNIAEVWYDLGAIYDVCNQAKDALDAFRNVVSDPKLGPIVQEYMADIQQRAIAGIRPPGVKEGEPPSLERNGRPLAVEPPAPLPELPVPQFHSAFSDYSLLPPNVVSLFRELEAMQKSFEPKTTPASYLKSDPKDEEAARKRRMNRSSYRSRNGAVVGFIQHSPEVLAQLAAMRPTPRQRKPPQPTRPKRHYTQSGKPRHRTKNPIIAAVGHHPPKQPPSALKRSLPFTQEKPTKHVHFE